MYGQEDEVTKFKFFGQKLSFFLNLYDALNVAKAVFVLRSDVADEVVRFVSHFFVGLFVYLQRYILKPFLCH